jgi:hypothetical protein
MLRLLAKSRLWDSAATFRTDTVVKITFILLNQFDLALTVFALRLNFSELNPFLGSLLTSPVRLLIIKLFIPIVLGWLVPGKLLWPSIVLLTLITIWNLKELILYLV